MADVEPTSREVMVVTISLFPPQRDPSWPTCAVSESAYYGDEGATRS